MSTNMELIEAKTLVATAPSITFSAIPQTYTDLKILVSARDDRAGQPSSDLSLRVGYNGTINTGSIYSAIQLYGSGSTAGSQSSATTYLYLGMATGPTATANTFGNTEIYIPNYTSANYKSVSADGVSENNATTAYAVLNAGLISTSNPITDIQISADYGSGNYQIGSTFYLYGISNVTSTPKATGGIVSSDGTYWYHLFPNTATFTPTESITADILVVGGGGAGGANIGGGGGAGGLRYFASESLTATSYTCTVGAGGSGPSTSPPYVGTNGSTSQFGGLTSTVGGGFGGGSNNGSASGSGASSGGNRGPDPIGTASLGNIGANHTGINGAGGGGGFSGAGVQGTSTTGGTGGIGTATYQAFAYATGTGDNGYYAGGGGGSGFSFGSGGPFGFGGLGGGGDGMVGADDIPRPGKQSTGGGGGGGFGNGTTNPVQYNNGGSGVIIVRYLI